MEQGGPNSKWIKVQNHQNAAFGGALQRSLRFSGYQTTRGSIPLGSTTPHDKQLNRRSRRQIWHETTAHRVGIYAEAVYQSARHDERHSGADQLILTRGLQPSIVCMIACCCICSKSAALSLLIVVLTFSRSSI